MWALLMGLETVSPQRLHQRLQTEPITVIDVNSRQSWATAHVPGAVHLDPVVFDTTALPDDKDATLVFYCSNPLCRKAPQAARRAAGMGYRRVQVMAAGIKGWLDANLPTDSGDAPR